MSEEKKFNRIGTEPPGLTNLIEPLLFFLLRMRFETKQSTAFILLCLSSLFNASGNKKYLCFRVVLMLTRAVILLTLFEEPELEGHNLLVPFPLGPLLRVL